MCNSAPVYEVHVKLTAQISLYILIFTVTQACSAQCNGPSPLSRQVSHFRLGPTSILNALLWLGHDYGVCFGIEYSGSDLNNTVQVDENKTTVGAVTRKILGDTFQVSVAKGVVLIRRKGANTPDWLTHRLHVFTMPRVELMNANDLLWMGLEMDLDKTKHGFGGSHPQSEPRDEVGPFREHDKTMQQLLTTLVASSHGASWYATNGVGGTSFDSTINRFWTLATYRTRNLYRPSESANTSR